jgi:hypothetical protein
MNLTRGSTLLAFYAGVVTSALGFLLLSGFGPQKPGPKFDEIEVHRINVVEPDGTLRMVISNKAAFPGAIIRGKEYPHAERKTAGMLFFNDEGTENGGLIFGGSKDKGGHVESYGHLSFDQYEQVRFSRLTPMRKKASEHRKSPFGTVQIIRLPMF